MHHWSRPFAASERDDRRTVGPFPGDAVDGPRVTRGTAMGLARRTAGHAMRAAVSHGSRAWSSIRHHEERLAERHRVSHVPVATRRLAAGLVGVMTLGFGGLFAVRGDAGPTTAPAHVATDDPMSTLRVRLPALATPVVAGATLEAEAPVAAPDAAPGSGAAASLNPPKLLPTGKGMWFHYLEQTGLDMAGIANQARAAGLTHLYVRVGSSKRGFHGAADLDRLLPAAHAAGLRVVGWDFPYLQDPNADIQRALDAIAYTTPDGHRLDAFSADIETRSEGVELVADRVEYYAANVRYYVGPGYPLIGTVPNACLNTTFPYAEVARHFDALAPMVYWITRDPAADVACNIDRLTPLGVAVMPVGQAYDPAIDNPSLVGLMPGYDHLRAFMLAAAEKGATAVSFWAWHTASGDMWRAISDAPWYSLVPMAPGHGAPDQVAVLQRLLNLYGYSVPVDGVYDAGTIGALAQLQHDLGLSATGTLDDVTIRALVSRG